MVLYGHRIRHLKFEIRDVFGRLEIGKKDEAESVSLYPWYMICIFT